MGKVVGERKGVMWGRRVCWEGSGDITCLDVEKWQGNGSKKCAAPQPYLSYSIHELRRRNGAFESSIKKQGGWENSLMLKGTRVRKGTLFSGSVETFFLQNCCFSGYYAFLLGRL